MAVHSEILGAFSSSSSSSSMYLAAAADTYSYRPDKRVLQVISIDVSNTDPLSTTLDEDLEDNPDTDMTERLSGDMDCASVPDSTVLEGRFFLQTENCDPVLRNWDPLLSNPDPRLSNPDPRLSNPDPLLRSSETLLRNSDPLSTLNDLERTDIDQDHLTNLDQLDTVDHLDYYDPLNTMEPYAKVLKPLSLVSRKSGPVEIGGNPSTGVIVNQPNASVRDPRVSGEGAQLPGVPAAQLFPNYVTVHRTQPEKSAVTLPEGDQRITRVAAILRGDYGHGNTNQSNQDGLGCLEHIEDGYSTISKYRNDKEEEATKADRHRPPEISPKQSEIVLRQPKNPAPDASNSTMRYSSCTSPLEINTSRQKLLRDDKVRFGTLDPRKLEDVTKSVFRDGCYVNPWDTWRDLSFSNGLKFMCMRSQSGVPSRRELDGILPVLTPDMGKIAAPPSSGVNVTWLGHAGLLVQFDGVSVLTDPVLSSYCGPASLVGYKRYRPTPCAVGQLPKIHAVVVSHSHYDHLDLPTVQQLNARFGSGLRWFVPLGLKDWFTQTGVEDVIELDWWQENCIPSHSRVTFAFTPAQHWSMRNYVDRNKSLWGSWSIMGPNHSFFFAGDTGYCKAFKEIGQRYGPFDVAAIPIGAYKPRSFLAPQHVDPPQAVQIHADIQARQSVGIHWGTFELGKEHYLAPREDLKTAVSKAGLTDQDFFTLNHGETRLLAEEEDQRGE